MKTILLDLNQNIKDIKITEDSEIIGLLIGSGNEQITRNFKIIHELPGLKSQIKIKAVLNINDHFDFRPLLSVKRGAKLTETYLKVDVLLLSGSAKATILPALEITENDIKAGHGATIGRIDRNQLFYLTSRGLSEAAATEILIAAFVSDLQEKIAHLNN